ncbi:MAG: hypothetical protein FWG07_10610 [Treponema sp.]|nr:hypothetical protein [Treponema sp.]
MKITHNRNFYVFSGIIIFMVLAVSMSVYIIMPRGRPLKIEKTDEFFGILEDGDIICRLAVRFWSELFSNLSVTDKRFSHMGIIRIHNGIVTVIHAEGSTGRETDYVSEVPLAEFLQVARRIGVYRINGAGRNQLAQTALEYTGIPFDWQFDMDDESKLYCTELLYVILKRIMPDVKLNTVYLEKTGKEIIPLEAVSNSEFFSEVYFIDNNPGL